MVFFASYPGPSHFDRKNREYSAMSCLFLSLEIRFDSLILFLFCNDNFWIFYDNFCIISSTA